jgi:hypothetical protein
VVVCNLQRQGICKRKIAHVIDLASSKKQMRKITHAKREELHTVICSSLPPEVAFETAHAASFFISNSAVARRDKSGEIFWH